MAKLLSYPGPEDPKRKDKRVKKAHEVGQIDQNAYKLSKVLRKTQFPEAFGEQE